MFSELKILAAQIAAHGIVGKPNKLPGPTNENKKTFDELTREVVVPKFNALIDALGASTAAGEIGIAAISGLEAANVQAALAELLGLMQGITQGAVANGSITTAKLADSAVTADKLANGAVTGAKLSDGGVAAAKLSAGAVTTEKIAALAVTAALLAAGCVTTEKLSDGAVTTGKLSDAAVTRGKLADSAVNTDKLGDLAVTAAKLAAGAVTAVKLGSDVNYAAVGLGANQVRPIYVQSSVPTSGSPDGIYLVTEE